MAVNYYLELFPTEGNWDMYVKAFGGTEIERNDDNAGVDLYCVKDQSTGESKPIKATLLDLGVKARMTKFFFEYVNGERIEKSHTCHFWLAPRSSIWKNGVTQANSLGIIDSSYRGTLMGAVLPIDDYITIQAGTRLFQILAPDMGYITKVSLKPLSELDQTSRGEGGFGSTGK
jgi:dUTP pyrophosphatase